jgi:hypothetical protein
MLEVRLDAGASGDVAIGGEASVICGEKEMERERERPCECYEEKGLGEVG